MQENHYERALRMGQKEQRIFGMQKTLPVIPESLENGALTREPLSVIEIPLELIVGTCTEGRSKSFSPSFYPLMAQGTEFASKWNHLCKAHLNEGLRDPIKAVEYLGNFYVIEGHKRVSVLKYFGAVSIQGNVTRLHPAPSEEKEVQIYKEFLYFYQVTGLYVAKFSRLGGYQELLDAVGYELPWSAEHIRDFRAFYTMFSNAFQAQGGEKSHISEALIAYLRVFSYNASKRKLPAILEEELQKIRPEITSQIRQSGMTLLLSAHGKRSLISGLWSGGLCAAFVYGHSPEENAWVYAHELGRRDAESTMQGQIRTLVYCIQPEEAAAVAAMEDAIKKGADVIFAPESEMVRACVQIAAKYPNVKVLNCALTTTHPLIRTYYLRLYEAKFLAGALAGALTPNDRIAYLSGNPSKGAIPSINAFARGAQMTNPRAQISLEWIKHGKTYQITEEQIFYMDDFDLLPAPNGTPRAIGLYDNTGEQPKNLAIAICRWGEFYRKMLYRILDGNWKSDGKKDAAVSYWWGMDAGVVDVIYSRSLPEGVRQLTELLREAICNERIGPFSGTMRDQEGQIRYCAPQFMQPQEILNMDWLAENVIGTFPDEKQVIV